MKGNGLQTKDIMENHIYGVMELFCTLVIVWCYCTMILMVGLIRIVARKASFPDFLLYFSLIAILFDSSICRKNLSTSYFLMIILWNNICS